MQIAGFVVIPADIVVVCPFSVTVALEFVKFKVEDFSSLEEY